MIAAFLFAALQATAWEPVKLPEAAAGKALRGVTAVDAKTAWIVGDQGLCLLSKDAGRTWTVNPLETKATLRSIRFLDEKRGFITGDGDPDAPKATGHIVMGRQMTSGTLLWTVDGGRTWKKAHPPTNFEILCAESRGGPVQLGNSGGAGHLDGDVLRSAPGYEAWKSSRCFRALFDIRAIDERQWVAAGSAVSVGFMPPPKDPLYLAKACRILFSRDGGENWEVAKGSEGTGVLRSLAAGPQRLLAVGDQGAVLVSEDKGATWTATNSGCEQVLCGVAWGPAPASVAVAVGDQETTLVSSDAGKTWKRTSSGNAALLGVAVLGDSFVAIGENGLTRRASVKALLAAKALEAPAKPVAKGPTPTQRERTKPGSAAVYEVDLDAPALKMKSNFQREEKIASVSATGYKVDVQLVKGSGPPGTPSKGSVDVLYENLLDFNSWKVGESREESGNDGHLTKTRLPDETVQVGDRKLDCFVIEMKAKSGDGGTTVQSKDWFAKSTEIPGVGIVNEETVQEIAAPQGRIRITQTIKLVSWGRAKE